MSAIFHVHTYRCGHAGDEKERKYIERAIALGAAEIWFSDHAPFPGDMFLNRMRIAELDGYVSILSTLKEAYKDKIAVRIGLEIEYIPAYESYYKQLKEDWGIEFLLLGQHFAALPNGSYTFDEKDKSRESEKLAEAMLQGISTGFFGVVAHPDQIFRREKEWNQSMDSFAAQLKCEAIRYGVALEKNISNMYEKKRSRLYRPEFWAEIPKGLKVVYGVDAHSVEEMETNYRKQEELYGKTGFITA